MPKRATTSTVAGVSCSACNAFISSAEGAEDGVAKFTSLVRARD